MATIEVIDTDKIGKKGYPLHYEALGIAPPMKTITVPDDEVPPEHTGQVIPDEISRRQFFQYLAVSGIISKDEALSAMQGGVIPAPLQAIIDQLPTEDDKFNAQMFVVGAQNFNRLHWLTDVVRQAMNWTLEQRDDFWREAAKL
ncbi:hypothetical protein R5W60_05630 [Brucella pseudintermedia]|uniref:hypothetical protein n=1 Tax=Brucella pseudintermedia TaxID=370111 RepID=UPI003671035C|nr:hypothetical protein R5W60_05630 [Brucella pseudintermedia]